jgi:hypothetical protein
VLEELVHFCLLLVPALIVRLNFRPAALDLAALDDVDHAPDQAADKAAKPCNGQGGLPYGADCRIFGAEMSPRSAKVRCYFAIKAFRINAGCLAGLRA